jgi:cell division protein FtsQ
MNRKQKITLWITAALVLSYLVVATGFVNSERQRIYCTAVQVRICDSAVNRFISVADVQKLIDNDTRKIIGRPIDQINMPELEEALNARSVVKNTEAFTSIDGILHIRVYQRRPIVRVLTAKGSFYIDETGYLFPFTSAYTSYVPIVTGNIPVGFKADYRGEIPDTEKLLKQIYAFSLFLDDNDFWASQVQQLHVQRANDVEIIPRVGNQVIKLGTLDNYEYKLKKLHIFYHKAMPQEGWNKYSKIDLRYSNQVVATKRQ